MDRRKFVASISGAAAGTMAGGTVLAGMHVPPEKSGASSQVQKHRIKRGVALYSYQQAMMVNGMTLEDMIGELSDIGAYGVEAMGQAIVEDYPDPSGKWLDGWWELMDRCGTIPVCYTNFHDQNLRRSRPMTTEENLAYLKRDLHLAKKMGFTHMRMLVGTPFDLLRAAIPVAADMGLWLGVEIHAPVKLRSGFIDRLLEISDKHPDTFGLIPDMGIFQRYPRPYLRERQIAAGALTRETALYIEEAFRKGVDQAEVIQQVEKRKPKPGDPAYVETVYRSHANYQDPKDLLPLLKYSRHIHGKFYEMSRGDTYFDTTVDYENVIPVLMQGGYNGYICSEYEGQRDMDTADVDEVDEVRRQHVMLKRMLGEP
jgi:hypothetical protein